MSSKHLILGLLLGLVFFTTLTLSLSDDRHYSSTDKKDLSKKTPPKKTSQENNIS